MPNDTERRPLKFGYSMKEILSYSGYGTAVLAPYPRNSNNYSPLFIAGAIVAIARAMAWDSRWCDRLRVATAVTHIARSWMTAVAVSSFH
jgi:hypothetical protein